MSTTSDTEHRLTYLETRCVYVDKALDDRARIACAHSQRLATLEHSTSTLSTTQANTLSRITRMEAILGDLKTTRDMQLERKKERKAIIQWALSIVMAIGMLAGFMSRHEGGLIERILGGLLLHP